MKICCQCDKPVGPTSKRYCEYHAGYHAGHAAFTISLKRSMNPKWLAGERNKLKLRMRKLRAKRRSAQHTLPA